MLYPLIITLLSLPYNRSDWGRWIDADRDCQNTRTEILIRDNTDTDIDAKACKIIVGRWRCPYSGTVYHTASNMDIDHIVPLAYAHRAGGANWGKSKKREFANDPLNLLTVKDNINQSKGSKDPTRWLPPLKSYHKEYLHKWNFIIKKYKLKGVKMHHYR